MESFRFFVTSVFLPRVLPDAAPADEFDGVFVRAVAETLRASAGSSAAAADAHAVFSLWADLVGPVLSGEQLGAALAVLRVGEVFPVHVKAQNAVVTVKLTAEDKAAVGVFQVSAPNEKVTGAVGDLAARFPAVTVEVPVERVAGEGGEFGRQLAALATTAYDEQYPIAQKRRSQGAAVPERRDVPAPTYVTEWLLGVMAGCQVPASDAVQVTKKIRDAVSWADAELPWRRAGEWMAVKAVLHVWFVDRLGVVAGTDAYKAEMLAVMTAALERASMELALDGDLLLHMAAKVARRAAKLRAHLDEPRDVSGGISGAAIHGEGSDGAVSVGTTAHFQAVLKRASAAVVAARAVLDRHWTAVMAVHTADAAVVLCADKLNFLPDTRLSLKTAAPLLNLVLAPSRPRACPSAATPVCIRRVQGTPRAPYFPGFRGMKEDDQTQVLWDFEAWVTYACLDQALVTDATASEMLAMLVAYVQVASRFYADDPVGHSALVLTAYTLVAMMDAAVCAKYPLFKEHQPGVDLLILTQLLLPLAEQMRQLSAVEAYFLGRAAGASGPALLATARPTAGSFAVRYAQQDSRMRTVRDQMLAQIKEDVAAKVAEVRRAQKACKDLEMAAMRLSCEFHTSRKREVHSSWCLKCSKTRSAARMKVHLYEILLPDDEVQQFAIVFDVCGPRELSHLTDALYILRFDVCRSTPGKFQSQSIWSKHGGLSRWVDVHSPLVRLGSASKPFLKSHYMSGLHPSYPSDDFVVPNGCDTELCVPSRHAYATRDHEDGRTLKIVLSVPDGPYRTLQVR